MQTVFFTNRKKELKQLNDYFEMICSGNPQNIGILGLRRIGKSVLLKRFYKDKRVDKRAKLIYSDFERMCISPDIFAIKYIANIVNAYHFDEKSELSDFMKIEDRVYDFRGLKSLWSAPIIMAGLVIQHNFIEEHTTTKKVPCSLAGQDLDLGENRWLGLIKMASI